MLAFAPPSFNPLWLVIITPWLFIIRHKPQNSPSSSLAVDGCFRVLFIVHLWTFRQERRRQFATKILSIIQCRSKTGLTSRFCDCPRSSILQAIVTKFLFYPSLAPLLKISHENIVVVHCCWFIIHALNNYPLSALHSFLDSVSDRVMS